MRLSDREKTARERVEAMQLYIDVCVWVFDMQTLLKRSHEPDSVCHNRGLRMLRSDSVLELTDDS